MVLWAKLSEPNCIVSSDGRIFSVRRQRFAAQKKYAYIQAPFEVPQFINKGRGGYKQIALNGKNYQVHRLVALAFIGECPKGFSVDHIDRNVKNNDISNLRYANNYEQALNRGIVEEAHKRLGDYKDKKEYERKRLESKGLFLTSRNGKSILLPLSERKFKRRKHEVSCESGV